MELTSVAIYCIHFTQLIVQVTSTSVTLVHIANYNLCIHYALKLLSVLYSLWTTSRKLPVLATPVPK